MKPLKPLTPAKVCLIEVLPKPLVPLRPGFPSSTLLPFFFGGGVGSLIKAENSGENRYPYD